MSATETGRFRTYSSNPTTNPLNRAVFQRDPYAKVDEWDEVLVREAIENRTAPVIVCAGEGDVAVPEFQQN